MKKYARYSKRFMCFLFYLFYQANTSVILVTPHAVGFLINFDFNKLWFEWRDNNTGLQKKNPRMKFQYSARSEILWQRSKNQQNRLFIGCLYAEGKRKFQSFAYVKCFSRNTFHPYVQFQALDTFLPEKKSFKIIFLSCKGVLITQASIF